ncbi:MAG: peptidase domain-containing ABC transporter [Ignavibacteria bacterium]|nr:peptidase domain-containing ABC transporter [Ignavibacteria bacterium]
MDCGPSCLKIICKYYRKDYSFEYLREKSHLTTEGTSLWGLSEASENIGFRTFTAYIPLNKLDRIPLPCIAHFSLNHFLVIYKVSRKFIYVSDPAYGLIKYSLSDFSAKWEVTEENGKKERGLLLLLEPGPQFYSTNYKQPHTGKNGYKFLFPYLVQYKGFVFQLLLGLLLGSFLSLLFPLTTQALVDIGINLKDISFVYLILIAQLVLFVSQASVEFIRSWLLMYLGTKLNISLVSDFLVKIMKLPISFFDTRKTGDIFQRIGDHSRVQAFLTSSSLSIMFSVLNLFIFSIVLILYSQQIFLIFFLSSICSIIWVTIFLKMRRDLDFKRFHKMADSQNTVIQIVAGMPEIKLNGNEKVKRWEWEKIQAKLFNFNIKSLALNQYQQLGSLIINQSKNILITFLAAKGVIEGELTLGMMLAIIYILGQINAPIEQLIQFIQITQEAKISLDRIGEVHEKNDEESISQKSNIIFPPSRDILLNSVSFEYNNQNRDKVLKDLTLKIDEGINLAVVGASGSGKTTLLKLLLRFYEISSGEITVGGKNLKNFSYREWRKRCGVVMQDGYIFADTIASNITLASDKIDKRRLDEAIEIANISEFTDSLTNGIYTRIDINGQGLSHGQKQRILIARAVYKNPEYIFFDEATSALDTQNESDIMSKLGKFCESKTVIIIAHRLSTVKNADKIVVLDKGIIAEQGIHSELLKFNGFYYKLVSNQLELENS